MFVSRTTARDRFKSARLKGKLVDNFNNTKPVTDADYYPDYWTKNNTYGGGQSGAGTFTGTGGFWPHCIRLHIH